MTVWDLLGQLRTVWDSLGYFVIKAVNTRQIICGYKWNFKHSQTTFMTTFYFIAIAFKLNFFSHMRETLNCLLAFKLKLQYCVFLSDCSVRILMLAWCICACAYHIYVHITHIVDYKLKKYRKIMYNQSGFQHYLEVWNVQLWMLADISIISRIIWVDTLSNGSGETYNSNWEKCQNKWHLFFLTQGSSNYFLLK